MGTGPVPHNLGNEPLDQKCRDQRWNVTGVAQYALQCRAELSARVGVSELGRRRHRRLAREPLHRFVQHYIKAVAAPGADDLLDTAGAGRGLTNRK